MSASRIYLEAARIIAQGEHKRDVGGWSCLAVAKATLGKEYTDTNGISYLTVPTVQRYEKAFALWPGNSFGNSFGASGNPIGHSERILALCFMAAMVETGDA